MKVIKERTILIKYVVPESDEEAAQLKKIISEVQNEKVDQESLRIARPGEPVKD